MDFGICEMNQTLKVSINCENRENSIPDGANKSVFQLFSSIDLIIEPIFLKWYVTLLHPCGQADNVIIDQLTTQISKVDL